MRRKQESSASRQYCYFDRDTGKFTLLENTDPYGSVSSTQSVRISRIDQNGELVPQHTLTDKEKRQLEKKKRRADAKAAKARKKEYHSFYDRYRSYRRVDGFSSVPLYDPEEDYDDE